MNALKDTVSRATLSDFHQLCETVVRECNNPYAVAYAKAGLDILDSRECYVQCLYILNNIRYWRGAFANDVRKGLRKFVRENK